MIVASSLPEARVAPSGEKATALINSLCPASVTVGLSRRPSRRADVSHTVTDMSLRGTASVRPSGENATAPYHDPYPSRLMSSFHVEIAIG